MSIQKRKKIQRRDIIKLGVTASVGLPLMTSQLLSCDSTQSKNTQKQSKGLSILILGGTSFLGPHQIAYALDRGHTLTTFTRGKTLPTVHQDKFKDVEQLIGDRNDDLSALENRKWDVVIDNSGRKVEWTEESAKLLKDSCDLYVYTSSTGVFYPYIDSEFREDSEVLLEMPITDDEDEKIEYGYGVMKAKSEMAARTQFGDDRTIVVRPTYMFGPGDRTDRFTYWPVRLKRGGEVMVPGKIDDPVQYVDVRDVAEWMIRLIEQKKTGTFNAVGPKTSHTMKEFVKEATQEYGLRCYFQYIDDYDFLLENGISYIVPWIMPTGNNKGSALINNQKAISNGLTFRDLELSMEETFYWWMTDAVSEERKEKLEAQFTKEREVIKKWKALM